MPPASASRAFSPSNLIHLDTFQHARCAQFGATLAVAIATLTPNAGNRRPQCGVGFARAQQCAQIPPCVRKQSGTQLADGRQARARATAT
jgi:hypothetical protein